MNRTILVPIDISDSELTQRVPGSAGVFCEAEQPKDLVCKVSKAYVCSAHNGNGR